MSHESEPDALDELIEEMDRWERMAALRELIRARLRYARATRGDGPGDTTVTTMLPALLCALGIAAAAAAAPPPTPCTAMPSAELPDSDKRPRVRFSLCEPRESKRRRLT